MSYSASLSFSVLICKMELREAIESQAGVGNCPAHEKAQYEHCFMHCSKGQGQGAPRSDDGAIFTVKLGQASSDSPLQASSRYPGKTLGKAPADP